MAKPTPSGDAPAPRQAVVYRTYLELQSIAAQRFSGALAGRLVLSIGFDHSGAELALATTIAGGVFLGIEPDTQTLKTAVRNGSCDFMVNTLDEALRVLKNELRKRTPLSAGLLGNPEDILPEMIDRGVQPDLIADTAPHAAVHTLVERGAQILTPADTNPTSEEVIWTAANPEDLRRMDRIALDSIPAEDQVRRRWLEQAPGNFHRQIPLERVVVLRPEEMVRLLELAGNAHASSPFQAPVAVRWKDSAGVEKTTAL